MSPLLGFVGHQSLSENSVLHDAEQSKENGWLGGWDVCYNYIKRTGVWDEQIIACQLF